MTPLTVLYDGEMFTTQPAGGVNRYFERVIGGLPRDWTPVLTTAERRDVHFPAHPRLRVHHFQRYGFRPGRVAYWLEPHVFRFAERRAHADVLHPTDYRLLTRRAFDRVRTPLVVTVWDMIHELFAARMDPTGRVAAEKRRAVEAAALVVCISESTRRDLLARIPVPPERVVVTHLAGGIDPAVAGAPVGGRPYLLHVGSRAAGYKNFDGLLAAFARVVARVPDVLLRTTGRPFDADETRRIAELRLTQHVVHEGLVADTRLAALYRDALALVVPSLYEGFGIPPLEAAACGTAVAAARVASLPEVLGDDAAWFDPHDVDAMAHALLGLVEDAALRTELAARGPARAARYSWERTVAETVAVYRRAVASAS